MHDFVSDVGQPILAAPAVNQPSATTMIFGPLEPYLLGGGLQDAPHGDATHQLLKAAMAPPERPAFKLVSASTVARPSGCRIETRLDACVEH